jgi:hypothetical protein
MNVQRKSFKNVTFKNPFVKNTKGMYFFDIFLKN